MQVYTEQIIDTKKQCTSKKCTSKWGCAPCFFNWHCWLAGRKDIHCIQLI